MQRLPNSAHAAQPWLIHELASDFALQDTWSLDTPGGPDEFAALVGLWTAPERREPAPRLTRALFRVRWTAGRLLRFDDADEGLGARVETLRDRLPAELRDAADVPVPSDTFSPLYLTDREWASELANRTVHAVAHLGWVQGGDGAWRGQLSVLVKRNGALGAAYMALIDPFRRWIVYPSLLGRVERAWRETAAAGLSVSVT